MSRPLSIAITRCRSAVPPSDACAPHISADTCWLIASHLAVLLGSADARVRAEVSDVLDAIADALDDVDERSRREMEKSGPVPKARPAFDSVHDRTLAELMAGAGGAGR